MSKRTNEGKQTGISSKALSAAKKRAPVMKNSSEPAMQSAQRGASAGSSRSEEDWLERSFADMPDGSGIVFVGIGGITPPQRKQHPKG